METGNISKELMCAMRVHLMNETEMNVFCPAEAKVMETVYTSFFLLDPSQVFHENCQNVEFMNYTAISLNNELHVIEVAPPPSPFLTCFSLLEAGFSKYIKEFVGCISLHS
jgi:hypothetical protein